MDVARILGTASHERLERRWQMLARSHEFAKQLTDFSNETNRRLDELPRHADP
jgi:hypothetical protein